MTNRAFNIIVHATTKQGLKSNNQMGKCCQGSFLPPRSSFTNRPNCEAVRFELSWNDVVLTLLHGVRSHMLATTYAAA